MWAALKHAISAVAASASNMRTQRPTTPAVAAAVAKTQVFKLAIFAVAAGVVGTQAMGATAPAGAPNSRCSRTATAVPAMARLRDAMAHGHFIAYQPTSLQVENGHTTPADPASIRADLQVLRPRFDSLITYDSIHGAEAIPSIAASLGYRAIIIGIWNPFNQAELDAALTAAKNNPKLVIGLSLGNEMLFFHRHGADELVKLLDRVHAQAPQLALTTTEPFHMFYEPVVAPGLLERLDFLLANVHPIFEPWFKTATDDDAAQFVVNVVSKLATTYCGPILVKETGVPTAPAEKGFTEQRQAGFYEELQRRLPATSTHAFAYFSAFDAPWRLKDGGLGPGQHPQPEEAHFGLYDERRQPKPVVAHISPLPKSQ